MNSYLELIYRRSSSIVPVFLVIGLGAFLSKRLKVHLPTLNALTLNVLSPCLLFDAVVRQGNGGSFLPILLSAILLVLLCLFLDGSRPG